MQNSYTISTARIIDFERVVSEVVGSREAGSARQKKNRQGEARISLNEGEGGDIQDEHLGMIK
jgi:hypothetical protein